MSLLGLSLIFDFFLFIVVGYFIFRGTKKGAIDCLFSLLALFIAFPITCYFFPLFASLFPQKVTNRILGDAIAFATTLICLYFFTFILIWTILKAFKRFHKDISNQIAGGILGILEGVAVIFIIILLMITLLPPKTSVIKNSFLSRSTISVVSVISKSFPLSLKRKFIQKRRELEVHWKQTHRQR